MHSLVGRLIGFSIGLVVLLSLPATSLAIDEFPLLSVQVAVAATVTVDDPTVTEGDAGTSDATFTVTLTSVEAADLTLDYTTVPGLPADPIDDFTPQTGQITFAVGETTKTIPVPVVGDTTDEASENFFLELTGQGLAETVTGTATILDEDATLSIADVTVTEGNAGTTNAAFTVTASSTDSGNLTVDFATANGGAIAPADYAATSGTLTFAEGTALTQSIIVPVVGDTFEESYDTFFVNLTNPSANASIADAQGLGTIANDDFDPPETTIDTGPADVTNDSTPTFTFSSSDTGATFECRVDTGSFAACATPFVTQSLAEGAHTFDVRARDAAGNTDPTPATRSFAVDTTAPETTIDTGPADVTNDSTPTFTFSSSDTGATFECRVDTGSFAACATPFVTAERWPRAPTPSTCAPGTPPGTPTPPRRPARSQWTRPRPRPRSRRGPLGRHRQHADVLLLRQRGRIHV